MHVTIFLVDLKENEELKIIIEIVNNNLLSEQLVDQLQEEGCST